uniref:DUF4290 domain-containing protein n=1 Tax=Segatella hominis TaxID=2518605 RepID=UPI0040272B7F
MNIEGLDYNTQREKLVLPEYGREIQSMVDHAVGIKDRAERQHCAESIIAIMDHMFPDGADAEEHHRKLWDHLAIMSGFKLDIDYPFAVKQAEDIAKRPDPMDYPKTRIPVRHYGSMMFELFDRLKNMEPGKERDELVKLTANQMRRDLAQWSHGSCDEEKVAADLARFTDGKTHLDLKNFKFEKLVLVHDNVMQKNNNGQRNNAQKNGSQKNNNASQKNNKKRNNK